MTHKEPTHFQLFEQFVADLLKSQGQVRVRSSVVYTSVQGKHYEVDILYGEVENETVVEVKSYRFRSPPPPDLFLRALLLLRMKAKTLRARRALLVISCPLTSHLARIHQQFNEIEIWDAPKLLGMTVHTPDLRDRLESLLEVTYADALSSKLRTGSLSIPPRGPTLVFNDPVARGKEIGLALKNIPPGRTDSTAFEDKCIEALKYLFERDLFGWHEQHKTIDGLHRRDLICRILPNAEVWKLMLADLSSRYVVFEFKNYSEPITQAEITSTERYLFPKALRRVAVVISPHGCAESAKIVIQGAMREEGKMLLSLKVDEIVELLIGMDEGSDPNTFLFEQVDEFLMGLGR